MSSQSKFSVTERVIWMAIALALGCAAGWFDRSGAAMQASALVVMLAAFVLTLPGRAHALLTAAGVGVGTALVSGAFSGLPVMLILALVGAAGGQLAGAVLGYAAAPLDASATPTELSWPMRPASSRFLLAVALSTVALTGAPTTIGALIATGHPAARWLGIVWQIMTLVGWIAFTPLVLRRRTAKNSPETATRSGLRPIDLATHLLTVFGLTALHIMLMIGITGALFIPLVPSALRLAQAATTVFLPLDFLAYLAILAIGYLSDIDRLRRDALQREEALRAESLENRLGALRARLNPHFLFNALNSVVVLAQSGKSEETVRVVEGLTGLLRYVLDDRRAMVPLGEELDFVRRYLTVQQTRFGERLRFEVSVADDVETVSVPQLLLQPLVENAVEHGVARALEGGSVHVQASRVGDNLQIVVEDDGIGLADGEPSMGIGLGNTRERLARLYDGRALLSLLPRAGRGARVQITLPIEMRPVATS